MISSKIVRCTDSMNTECISANQLFNFRHNS